MQFILDILIKIAVSFLQGQLASAIKKQEEAKAAQQKAEADGIRDEKNAVKYREAKTRADQIKAAGDLINRNN